MHVSKLGGCKTVGKRQREASYSLGTSFKSKNSSDRLGKAEAVLLDAKAYQEVASQLDAVASIRRSLAQARKGAGRPAEEVFDELERENA